jgi:hypothetical protein
MKSFLFSKYPLCRTSEVYNGALEIKIENKEEKVGRRE